LYFLAALQGIPQHLYEVVEMDGGGWWAKFKNVTIPMISPVIFLWTILEVIFSLQVFVEAYVMTKGGPLNSTYFIIFIYTTERLKILIWGMHQRLPGFFLSLRLR
jgi:multiple sugar transport system permease protein